MSAEFRIKTTTGLAVYAVRERDSDGFVWNGSAFVTPVTANWTQYDIAMGEKDTTGYYYGDDPAGAAATFGGYTVYRRVGGAGTEAPTDPVIGVGELGVRLGNTSHGGTVAVLTLERLIATSTTTNEPGFKVTGNGSAPGVLYQGGITGNGASYFGGATSGHGFYAHGSAAGSYGFWAEGVDAGAYFEGNYGMWLEGNGVGTGAALYAAANGQAVHFASTTAVMSLSTNGVFPGLYIETAGNGIQTSVQLKGLDIHGNTGNSITGGIPGFNNATGLTVTGAGTGQGVQVTAGATGNGIRVTTTNGDCINLDASGSGKVSINAVDGFNPQTYSAIAAAVWAFISEGAYTAVQLLRGIARFAFGKTSGGGTTTIIIRDLDDTKDSITATCDTDGNRTDVTKDLT